MPQKKSGVDEALSLLPLVIVAAAVLFFLFYVPNGVLILVAVVVIFTILSFTKRFDLRVPRGKSAGDKRDELEFKREELGYKKEVEERRKAEAHRSTDRVSKREHEDRVTKRLSNGIEI